MQKSFSKLYKYRKELIKEFEGKSDTLKSNQELVSYIKYLLIVFGESFFINKDFDINTLYSKLIDWLKNEKNLSVEEDNLEDIKLLKISQEAKILKMFGLGQPQILALYKYESNLSFFYLPYNWLDNPMIDSKLEKKSFWSNIFNDNIKKYILEYTLSQYSKSQINRVSAKNYYTEGIGQKFQTFLLSELEENENLIACLKVGTLRNIGQDKNIDKNLKWFYILTNFDSMLLGVGKNDDIIESFDLQNRQIKVKNGVRNPVIVDDYEWTTTLSNTSMYKEIEELTALQSDTRQNKIAILNVRKSKKNFKYYDYAKFLLKDSDNITSDISIFLLDYLKNPKETIEEYSKDEKLFNLLENILNNAQIEEELVYWYRDWNPPLEQALFVVKILKEIAGDDENQLKKILTFHSLIYKDAKKTEKDKLNKLLIDIDYADYLIRAKKMKEAEKILKEELKKMPDMSFAELLPEEKVDPTGNAGGQLLKVILLELLAKTQVGKAVEPYLKQAAILQPLSIEKIQKLSEVKDDELASKTNKILDIISKENLIPNQEKEEIKYKALDSSTIEIIKHPLYKNKSVFKSITKFLASESIPDSQTVKNFAEPYSPEKYPQVSEILTDLSIIFQIPNLDIFIAHGDNSIGIRSYKTESAYIIIGFSHLDKNSEYYMTYNELKYALTEELAFLYFDFARITSTDIWRGAMDKGIQVADTLLNLIPIVGSFSNVLKIKAFTSFIQKHNILSRADKIEKIADKSKNVILTTSEALGVMKKIAPKDSKEKYQNFVALSRMMQITADRAAISVTGDISSAVRSVFLQSKELKDYLPTIQKYGLNNFLLQKDNQGNYIYQNLAVRFASLFSFYLSDEYEKVRKKIQ